VVSGNDLLAKLRCFVLQLADFFFETVMDAFDRTQMEQALVDGIRISPAQVQHFLRPNDIVGPGLYRFVTIISAQERDGGLAEF
jgi:hypothetical protein